MSFEFGSDDEKEEGGNFLWMPSLTAAAANPNPRKSPDDDDDDNENHAVSWKNSINDNGDDDEDDDDDALVDWEDAGVGDDFQEGVVDDSNVDLMGLETTEITSPKHGVDATLIVETRQLQPVTIDLGTNKNDNMNRNNNNKKNKKTIAKRKINLWKYSQLSYPWQTTLLNLQRAHLLSWISHVTFVSSQLLSGIELAYTISFIPKRFCCWLGEQQTTTIPTLGKVQDFMTWYRSWLVDLLQQQRRQHLAEHGTRRRRWTARTRRRTNTDAINHNSIPPTLQSLPEAFRNWIRALLIISEEDNNNDPFDPLQFQTYQPLFSNLLCSCILRQILGWRVRWCMALKNVISLNLHVSHPWLANLLQVAALATATPHHSEEPTSPDNKTPPIMKANIDHVGTGKKRKRSHGQTSPGPEKSAPAPFSCGWGWMEIYCSSSSTSLAPIKKKAQWIHTDVNCLVGKRGQQQQVLLNRPDTVEPKLVQLEAANLIPSDHNSGDNDATGSLPQSSSILGGSGKKRIRSNGTATRRATSPVAFVLAVEHRPSSSNDDERLAPVYYSDVTPRYATSRVATLQRRGLSRLEIQNELKSYPHTLPSEQSVWWTRTLQTLNRSPQQHSNRTESVTIHESNEFSSPSQNNGHTARNAIDLYHDDEKRSNDSGSELDRKPPALEKVSSPEPTITIRSDRINLEKAVEHHRDTEEEDLSFSMGTSNEPMPTSKSGFQNHPVYALKSKLGITQVLSPLAKSCGLFAGEFVYFRRDVSTALEAHAWLYRHRKVKDDQIHEPVVRLARRKKSPQKTFQALTTYGFGRENDGSEEHRAAQIAAGSLPDDDDGGHRLLYAEWQTLPWSPPTVGPEDPIPLNEHQNVELALINPGLIHIDMPGAAVKAAKELGIPYAPCLIGFGKNGANAPVIRGIVVHQHNADIISQAAEQILQHAARKEEEDRQSTVYKLWKKLMVGILVKQRIDQEYGGENGDGGDNDDGAKTKNHVNCLSEDEG